MTARTAPLSDAGLWVHQLRPRLREVYLSGGLESLELRHQQALQEKLSYVDFLARLQRPSLGHRRVLLIPV